MPIATLLAMATHTVVSVFVVRLVASPLDPEAYRNPRRVAPQTTEIGGANDLMLQRASGIRINVELVLRKVKA